MVDKLVTLGGIQPEKGKKSIMQWRSIGEAVKKVAIPLGTFAWAVFWLPFDLIGTAIGTTVVTVIDLIQRILRETYKWAFAACIPLISAVAIHHCLKRDGETERKQIERDIIEAQLMLGIGALLEDAVRDIDSLKTVIDTLGPHQNTTDHKF